LLVPRFQHRLAHRVLAAATLVALILSPSSAGAQLASRPAADWIPTLDNPARLASMKIPDVVAALKIQPGDTVADVGAGSGVLTGPLAKATGAGGVLYASDIEPGLLTHIAQRMQADGVANVRTVLGSFTDPKLPAPVDLAFMNDVLHHVSDRAIYVKNLAGYLKPGGRLAVIEFTPEGSPHKGQPELIVAEAQTDAWARDAGLSPVERIELYDDRYFVVYRKP
jgi:SAM-dependent methyltransferase